MRYRLLGIVAAVCSCTVVTSEERKSTSAPVEQEPAADAASTVDAENAADSGADGGGTPIPITITLHDDADALAAEARRRMQGYLAKFDIADYVFKRAFKVVPGSSFSGETREAPIEISRDFGKDDPQGQFSSGDPDELFLTMLHEETHWSKAAESAAFDDALRHFETTYPDLAREAGLEDRPRVAYIHVPVNFYELEAGKRFLGPEKTYAILCKTPVYRAIYDVVLRDEVAIRGYLAEHGLTVERDAPPGGPHRCP